MATDSQLLPIETDTPLPAQGLTSAETRTPEELANIVARFAASDGWIDKVRLRADERWYERLYHGADYDIWVISWLPGQSTGFHDHGESSGAFVLATGTLEEHRPGEPASFIHPGKPQSFGLAYTHDVRNASLAPAISIHAYSPPLSEMNEYELSGSQLVPRETASPRAAELDQEWRAPGQTATVTHSAQSIEQLLATARGRLLRLTPRGAHDAVTQGQAILVDIRPESQRALEGQIPDALVIERNVLEWRFDPSSSTRLPVVTDHHLQVIVFCSEGYTSSLAAAALHDLGLYRATDVVGGFHAWCASGLPFVPPPKSSWR